MSKLQEILNKDLSFGKSFNAKQLASFYGQLHSYLKGGINLYQSIELISINKKFNEVQTILLSHLMSGQSLSQGMEETGRFSSFEVAMVRFGEDSGELIAISLELSAYYENLSAQRKKIIQAITYPLVTLVTAVLAVSFLLVFVVPIFEDVFKQFGGELPGITQFVLSISEFVQDYAGLSIVLLIAAVFGTLLIRRWQYFNEFVDRLLNHLPGIKSMLRDINNKRIFFSLLLGTNAGIPLNITLDQAQNVVNSNWIKEKLHHLLDQLFKGVAIHDALASQKLISSSELKLIKAGEESNNLQMAFTHVIQSIEHREQSRLNALTNFLEPALIVVVGGMIGLVLIAMYLPMFEVSNVIQ